MLVIKGIRFHGFSIPDCQKVLPPATGGKEMIPESMLWLLLTGRVPSPNESFQLSAELAEKGELPPFVEKLIDSCASLSLAELWQILTLDTAFQTLFIP